MKLMKNVEGVEGLKSWSVEAEFGLWDLKRNGGKPGAKYLVSKVEQFPEAWKVFG